MRNFSVGVIIVLAACSASPRAISGRDMQGVFSADASPGHRALIAEFLPDGRFGGDIPEPGGILRTQAYWRIGAVDSKRGCTVIETKPRQGEWREGFCASIGDDERTALNCAGEGDARTCLMIRKPAKKPSDTMTLGGSIPANR
jgi:hypothetical protein